jgi:uncharacterized protein (DUF488 family)
VPTLFTLGHGARSFTELVRICAAQGVGGIADVRRFPGSRRSPHFARSSLEATLPAHDIRYVWIPELGGRRHRPRDAPPSAWRVDAFAAYADHLNSAEFRAGWDRLVAAMAAGPTAVMCAEVSPYRCHRRLISDFAELHGIEVVHLLDERRRERHHVTPFAARAGEAVVYASDGQLELPLG